MPKFRSLPLSEAMIKSASGKRAQLTREYLGFIERLGRDEAGHLQVEEGESIAAAHLEASGMRIVERNFRTRYGEVDLVAEDGAALVFVEVPDPVWKMSKTK